MSNGVVQFDVAENVMFRAIIQQEDFDNAVRAIAEMEGLEPDEVSHGDVLNYLEVESPDAVIKDDHEVTMREIFHV